MVSAKRKNLPPPDEPSVAVLPGVNLSGDAKQDYFADGLMMDIITKLVKIPGLFVVGEGSTLTYRGQFASAALLGRELGVNHVLEGGVQTSSNRIRGMPSLSKLRAAGGCGRSVMNVHAGIYLKFGTTLPSTSSPHST